MIPNEARNVQLIKIRSWTWTLGVIFLHGLINGCHICKYISAGVSTLSHLPCRKFPHVYMHMHIYTYCSQAHRKFRLCYRVHFNKISTINHRRASIDQVNWTYLFAQRTLLRCSFLTVNGRRHSRNYFAWRATRKIAPDLCTLQFMREFSDTRADKYSSGR